jgi:thiol-disulfide isomerase/thioredoxin
MFDVQAKASSLLLGLSLASFAAFADPGLPPLTHGLTALPSGISAPSLRLPDLDEETTDLRDFRGQVVVLNFWATWCPPCRREMPSLERLRQQTDDEGLAILAVNIGEDADTVFSFLGTVEPTPNFPLLFDKDAASLVDWDVKGLPTTYVVAPDGSVAYRAVGGREFDHAEIIKQLRELKSARPDQ